jgi:hypothetical protein
VTLTTLGAEYLLSRCLEPAGSTWDGLRQAIGWAVAACGAVNAATSGVVGVGTSQTYCGYNALVTAVVAARTRYACGSRVQRVVATATALRAGILGRTVEASGALSAGGLSVGGGVVAIGTLDADTGACWAVLASHAILGGAGWGGALLSWNTH